MLHVALSLWLRATDILHCRRLDQVSAKALDLENLVREIANVVDTRTSRRIRDLLEKVWLRVTSQFEYTLTSSSMLSIVSLAGIPRVTSPPPTRPIRVVMTLKEM